MERWQSGRTRRTRNPVYLKKVSRVQIPPSPPRRSRALWLRQDEDFFLVLGSYRSHGKTHKTALQGGFTIRTPYRTIFLMSSWSVYIVRCCDGSLYTGISTDVARRIQQHNAGKGAAYTRSRRPIELVWTESNLTESLARKKEHEMKKWRKAAKELFLETRLRS